MLRRLPSLLLAALALPGLLGGQPQVVVHAHEGGAEAHHHAGSVLRGYLEPVRATPLTHRHDHDHDHDHDHHHGPAGDRERQGREPTESEHPGHEERHGHVAERATVAVRRSLLMLEDGPRLGAPAGAPLSACGRLLGVTAPNGPPPQEPDGHGPARAPRTAARLVQGLGLLI